MLISDKFENYAEKIKINLEEAGIRVEIDSRTEKIGYKIREARNKRVPYMIIIGEKEEDNKTVSVRSGDNGEEGEVDLILMWEILPSSISGRWIALDDSKQE